MRAVIRDINDDKLPVNTSSKYREIGERKELIEKYVNRKRKAISTTAPQKEKESRPNKPDLIGKHIFHKWVEGDGEQWIYGNVLKGKYVLVSSVSHTYVSFIDNKYAIS